MTKTHYRSVFLSDVHLGSKGCRAIELEEFLDSIECDYLFLVGDIIDLWKMKAKWYWPHEHNKIIRKLIKISKNTKVTYIPGNHDETFRQFAGLRFGSIEIATEREHVLASGDRVLVLHGDRFDRIICHNKWLAKLGARCYEWLILINRLFNQMRKAFGLKYWSLAGYLKIKAKEAVRVIDNFEQAVTTHAKAEGFTHVVCGHIHRAEVKEKNNVIYCNCGDWVESCTAIVETQSGRLELIRSEVV